MVSMLTSQRPAIGYVENIAFPGVTLVWEAQDIGLATGVLGSIRALLGAVATALYSSVFANKLGDNLPAYVAPAVVEAGLPESSVPDLFAAMPTGNFTAVLGMSDAVLAALTSSTQDRLRRELQDRLLLHHPLQRHPHLRQLLRAQHGEVPAHQRRQAPAGQRPQGRAG